MSSEALQIAAQPRSSWRRRTRWALPLLIVLAACGGAQKPRVPAGTAAVASLTLAPVEGTKLTVDRGTLRDGLALERARRQGEPFERYLVAVDARRLRAFYVRRGYFRAEVRSDVARAARPDRGGRRPVHVTFEIDEGPRAPLKRVEIVGIPPDSGLTKEALRALIPLADGAPFDYEVYDAAKPRFIAALERVGYAYASIDASVSADVVTDEAVIRIELDPGPLCQFGPITLRGIEGELAEAARARVLAVPGQRYSSKVLADARTALYAMGRFAAVRIEPDFEGEQITVPVSITVVEATRHELRLGGGVGMDPTSYEVRGRAGYSIAGFPTPLTTLRLEGRPALVRLRDRDETQPRVELSAVVERMDLFRPFVRGEVAATLAYRTVEAFTSAGPGIRLGVRSPVFDDAIQGSLGWKLEYLWFPEVNPAIEGMPLEAELGLDAADRIGAYEQRVSVDLRDDPVAPRQGLYGELQLEEGSAVAGGAFEYLALVPELRGYVPLGPVVLAGKLRLGAILGDVPVTRRFFAGGANSQRGFPERHLAPFARGADADGDPVEVVYGGAAMLEAGAELRLPLGKIRKTRLGGVVFLDGADVREEVPDLSMGALHWAAGAGLRIPTAIGAVRFDVGVRLNRTGADEPRPGQDVAYHVSIGEAF